MAPKLNKVFQNTPGFLLSALGITLDKIPPSLLNGLSDLSASLLKRKIIRPEFGDKLKKIASVLKNHHRGIYDVLVSTLLDPAQALSEQSRVHLHELDTKVPFLTDDLASQMMATDFMGYLPDDILVKVDRAAMSSSLETRVPLLDQDIVEFAWSLPLSMKIKEGQGKWILRKVLNKYVPSALVDRPKQGFSVPLNQWLRGDLKDWGHSLLKRESLEKFGVLDPGFVLKMWDDHLSKRGNYHHQLWAFLMLQSWLFSSKNI
jgi:asparagine synthase (glutamine-hydrolysing)